MSIALSLGNNLTTGGIFKPTAVNNTSVNNVTDFAGVTGGGTLVLLSTQTASASANISFTTGIDSTYDEYIFKYINIHPSAPNTHLQMNGSTDGGSSYNVVATTTLFQAYQNEAGSNSGLAYSTTHDHAQVSGYKKIGIAFDNDNDSCGSGYLHLFNPSDTTYVKHFLGISQLTQGSAYCNADYYAGYFNTTSAINAISFKMDAGNIDDGIIKMYGVAKS
jgi:hypothetical protein